MKSSKEKDVKTMKGIVISSNCSGGGKNHHYTWNNEGINETWI